MLFWLEILGEDEARRERTRKHTLKYVTAVSE
jgi:hypothetical protein